MKIQGRGAYPWRLSDLIERYRQRREYRYVPVRTLARAIHAAVPSMKLPVQREWPGDKHGWTIPASSVFWHMNTWPHVVCYEEPATWHDKDVAAELRKRGQPPRCWLCSRFAVKSGLSGADRPYFCRHHMMRLRTARYGHTGAALDDLLLRELERA